MIPALSEIALIIIIGISVSAGTIIGFILCAILTVGGTHEKR